MKYIFHLGRIPELSIAEIQAIFEKLKIGYNADFVSSKVLILDIKNKLDFKELLPQMGGTIKIAEIIGEYKNYKDLFESVISTIEKLNEERSGKKVIGYSIYFTSNADKNKVFEISKEIRKGFIEIKKALSKKINIRIVFPEKGIELKSASIIKNKIIEKGAEFNFVFKTPPNLIRPPDKGGWGVLVNQPTPALPYQGGNLGGLSKTIAVQDIESYSMRDYGRPCREVRLGMMPPKLAQIMINFAQVEENGIILDPFCGIGTVLQEALLNDYRAIGSDASGEQIAKTKRNLEWLSEKYILKYPNYKIFQSDSGSVFRRINENSIDAIVTESTLGPIYKKTPEKSAIKQNFNNLRKLYLRFFQNSKNILKKKARIVITMPAYKINSGKYEFAPFIDNLEKIGYSIVCPLDKRFIDKDIKLTKRNSIVYDRPDQIVAREVVVFENR